MCIIGHHRFSASGPHGCENHGGATPEEMLVPMIRIKRNGVSLVNYATSIRIKLHKPVPWVVSVNVPVSSAEAIVGNNVYLAVVQDPGTRLVFNLTGLSPGNRVIHVKVTSLEGLTVRHSVKVHFIGGIEERDQLGI